MKPRMIVQCSEAPAAAGPGRSVGQPKRGTACAGLLLCGLLLGWPSVVVAHELADGEIERWCEVVVRDEQIQLRYSLGYNLATEKQVREALTPFLPAAEDGDAAAKLDPAAEQQRWLAALTTYLTANLHCEMNGTRCDPLGCVIRPAGRHPMCWTVEFTFPPPPAGTECRLAYRDSAFPTFPGTARQAVRSKSNWVMHDTELATLLVRSKPLDWPAVTAADAASRPGARWAVTLAH